MFTDGPKKMAGLASDIAVDANALAEAFEDVASAIEWNDEDARVRRIHDAKLIIEDLRKEWDALFKTLKEEKISG